LETPKGSAASAEQRIGRNVVTTSMCRCGVADRGDGTYATTAALWQANCGRGAAVGPGGPDTPRMLRESRGGSADAAVRLKRSNEQRARLAAEPKWLRIADRATGPIGPMRRSCAVWSEAAVVAERCGRAEAAASE
jgi:hypothetical protein